MLPGRVRRFADRPGPEDPAHGLERHAARPGGGGAGPRPASPTDAFFYFVHSYYPDPARAEDVALSQRARRRRSAPRSRRDNVFGCQFHPEKSQAAGLALLRSFVAA